MLQNEKWTAQASFRPILTYFATQNHKRLLLRPEQGALHRLLQDSFVLNVVTCSAPQHVTTICLKMFKAVRKYQPSIAQHSHKGW